MTTDPNGAALHQLECRLFGAAGSDVPRLFLQAVRRHLPGTATTLARTHTEPSRHSVCWLDGALFGALSCAEYPDSREAVIRGVVVPLRHVQQATVKVHDVQHDPVTGEPTQWKRSTVFDLGGGKNLAFTATDSATLDTDEEGRFIDAIVLAMHQQ